MSQAHMSELIERLDAVRDLIEADIAAAEGTVDADWEGMSRTALATFDEALSELTRLQALVEQLAGALGEAFETLTYVFECSDDDIASRAAKETADKIDSILTAKGANHA